MKSLRVFVSALLAVSFAILGQLNPAGSAHADSALQASAAGLSSPYISHVSSYDLSNSRTALYLAVKAPKECSGLFIKDCYVYVRDSQGSWIFSKKIFGYDAQFLVIFNSNLETIFSQGEPTVTFGLESTTIDRMLKSETIAPPADSEYTELLKIQISKSFLQTENCNPLQSLIEQTQDLALKQDIMNSMIYNGQSEVNGYIAPAEMGVELDGLTQATITKKIVFGKPIQGPYFAEDFPKSGLYRTSVSNDAWAPVSLDCSNLVSATTREYLPFRVGVDGIVMYFHVLEGNAPSDTWVTLSGKSYQIQRNGVEVFPSGGVFKRCGKIVSGYEPANWVCFVPKKPGSYQMTVTQKYRGSGNLLIKCRSGFYGGVSCSTSTDRSTVAKKTGKFTVSSKGIVSGPEFWAY